MYPNRKNFRTRIRAAFSNSDPEQRRSAGNIFKFLALLLVFTLIARGTSGVTLARVELDAPIRSEIVDAVSGSATVSTATTLDITALPGLTIAEMLVGAGQPIEAGDAVAVFDLDDVEDRHIRETAALDRMVLDLERLERNEGIDESPIDTAQRSLSRAQEDYRSIVRQGEEDIAAARGALELLLTYDAEAYMLPTAIRNYQRTLEDFHATIAQSQIDIYEAAAAMLNIAVDDTALQNAIRNHQRALDDFNAAVKQGEADIASAQETLDELIARRPRDMDRTAIENAQRNLTRARDDYNAIVRQGEENIRNAEIALQNAWDAAARAMFAQPPNPAAEAAAWADVERAENALNAARNTADANRLNASRRVEDAQVSLAQAQRNFDDSIQGEIERAETALATAQSRAEDNLTSAERRLEDAEINLVQAQRNFDNNLQSAYESAQNAFESAQNRANDNIQAATRRLEDAASSANSEIERAETALLNAIIRAEETRLNAARRVEDSLTSLNTAQQNHQRNIIQNADTASQNIISASVMRLDFYAQQTMVESLGELMLTGGVLYASYGGIVSQAVQQGAVTSAAPIATIRDTSRGFEAQMQISGAEAERLTIGSEAEVTTGGGSIFFTPTTTGTISAISEPDEDNRVTVTIALPGSNWSVGQRIDAEIIINRANFDMSVPISALHSDNAGYFLFVMEQRNTVLGLQNLVERVNVTIVAADGDMVAVRGPVSRDSRVIVGSNKAISAGDRVRVVD